MLRINRPASLKVPIVAISKAGALYICRRCGYTTTMSIIINYKEVLGCHTEFPGSLESRCRILAKARVWRGIGSFTSKTVLKEIHDRNLRS
jgi:hypothetical protein